MNTDNGVVGAWGRGAGQARRGQWGQGEKEIYIILSAINN